MTISLNPIYAPPVLATAAPLTTPAPETAPAPTRGFNTDFSTLSRLVSAGAGGAFAANRLSLDMGRNLRDVASVNMGYGLRGSVFTGLKAVGLSALVGTGVAAAINAAGAASGKITRAQALSNVGSAALTSSVGGLGAVTLGGLGHLALNAMGVYGLPLTLVTTSLGAAGGVGAAWLKEKLLPTPPPAPAA